MAAGGFATTSKYFAPYLSRAAGTAGTMNISTLQVEHASSSSTWRLGQGVPRVVLTDKLGHAARRVGIRDMALTLAEI